MRKQKGVTLIELLLTITIMTVIIVPLIGLTTYILNTHRDVVYQNELQHEGRLIMEYISTKLREGALWDHVENKLVMPNDDGVETVLWYDGEQRILFGEEGAYIASQNVDSFYVVPLPDGEGHRLLIIELILVDQQTEEMFRMRNRLYERGSTILYESSTSNRDMIGIMGEGSI